MNQVYETQKMRLSTAIRFKTIFDQKVGTHIELNRIGKFHAYCVCFELEETEVFICSKIELSLIPDKAASERELNN